jgi:hypothetical protein
MTEKLVKQFQELEKLNRIEGIYEDVPEEVYNHPKFPGVRSGMLKAVVGKSFHHYQNQQVGETPQHFIDGQVFHSFMEGLTKDQIRAKYKMIGPDLEKYVQMSNSVRSHPRFEETHRDARREITFFTRCRYTGLLLRCRCDLWNPSSNLITDYKSTVDASPEAFPSAARRLKYRLSACFYAAVVNWTTGKSVDEFRIIAVEKKEPYFAAQYFYTSDSFELETETMVTGLRQIAEAQQGGNVGYTTDTIELRY